jgi:hypothetical protein
MKFEYILIIISLLYSYQVSWSKPSHEITADIANTILTPAAKAKIRHILENKSMANER